MDERFRGDSALYLVSAYFDDKTNRILQGAFTVCEGSIVRLGLSEVNPHRDIKIMELR